MQAFKFPDSMNVHFQCVVQVCRGACPNPQCGGGQANYGGSGSAPTATVTSSSSSSSSSSAQDGYGSPQAPAVDRYELYLLNAVLKVGINFEASSATLG